MQKTRQGDYFQTSLIFEKAYVVKGKIRGKTRWSAS